MDDTELDDFDEVEVGEIEEEMSDESDVDDAPVVKFVTKCLLDAIRKGASDLHFEPYEKSYRVRFRIDGILEEITTPPQSLAGKIASRIKVMSRLDVSERRVPQDGRIKLKISKNKAIDLRVALARLCTAKSLFKNSRFRRLNWTSTNSAMKISRKTYS